MNQFTQLPRYNKGIFKRLSNLGDKLTSQRGLSSISGVYLTRFSKSAAATKVIKNYTVIHEPPYLEDMKPKVGYYDLLNLQIKGHDFVVLEKYQSYLRKTMKKMEFNVVRAWSVPHKELLLENFGDKTTAVESRYTIKIYERNLQMKDALVTKLPILIDIINITTPPGVSFSIHRHTSEEDDRIYFKDSVLENLKEELKELRETPLIGLA